MVGRRGAFSSPRGRRLQLPGRCGGGHTNAFPSCCYFWRKVDSHQAGGRQDLGGRQGPSGGASWQGCWKGEGACLQAAPGRSRQGQENSASLPFRQADTG